MLFSHLDTTDAYITLMYAAYNTHLCESVAWQTTIEPYNSYVYNFYISIVRFQQEHQLLDIHAANSFNKLCINKSLSLFSESTTDFCVFLLKCKPLDTISTMLANLTISPRADKMSKYDNVYAVHAHTHSVCHFLDEMYIYTL